MRVIRCLIAALAVGAVTAAAAPSAGAATWADVKVGLLNGYDARSTNPCRRGDLKCLDIVIAEMQRRYSALARRCDHDAVFALAYLRTTQEFRRTVAANPSFFAHTRFMNYYDAVFASLYFDAYDRWHAGRTSAVPSAWRVALGAADGRLVAGAGSLMLGMNAHVNRDLPFTLDIIGLVEPNGKSLKPDHDKVNVILRRVMPKVLAETSMRFDPTIDDARFNGVPLVDDGLFSILQVWREEAWQNGVLLDSAASSTARATVANTIDTAASAEASSIKRQYAYLEPVTDTTARDAYCAVHWDD